MNSMCKSCGSSFQISDGEKAFIEKISPVFGGKKYQIPPPKLCPDCRLQLRVAHRNEKNLYYNTSSLSGQSLVSLYAPDTPQSRELKIYSHDEWWSEGWDAMTSGREFDFSRPFFDQFHELMKAVPRVALIQVGNENCPFTTGTGYCKNCHLINSSENCEDCYYGKLFQSCRDAMDCAYVYDSELLYECFYTKKCYNCVYVNYSQNCTDCYFSENLKSCTNCFLCTDLDNKQYYFMNRPMSKEQWEKGVAAFMGSHNYFEQAKHQLDGLRAKRIYKYANIVNSENSTGDFLLNCKNCTDSYDTNDSQDCTYVQVGVNVKDLYDCSNMYLKPELCYQTLGTIGVYNVISSLYIFNSQDVVYSQFCYNSRNLFGCVGLRNKQYCIFNKQFTKEQYEELVPKIIEHMIKTQEFGSYFPKKLTSFAYNESLAQEYFPLNREKAIAQGFTWRDEDTKQYRAQTYVMPDLIKDVPDSVLSELLACHSCGKNYKIISQELRRLKQMKVPLPRRCPDCRYVSRLQLRNPRELFDRSCSSCGGVMKSTFASNRPETVYCENCYLRTVL